MSDHIEIRHSEAHGQNRVVLVEKGGVVRVLEPSIGPERAQTIAKRWAHTLGDLEVRDTTAVARASRRHGYLDRRGGRRF